MRNAEPDMIQRVNNDWKQMYMDLSFSFLMAAKSDPRIGPLHITLYMALLASYREQRSNPIYIFAAQVMPLAKIAGSTTYHRTIRQLAAYRYIRYIPSYTNVLGSLVEFRLENF